MSSSPGQIPHRASRLAIARTVLVGVMIFLCAVSLYLCHRAILVMERAVAVMEHLDAKLDRAVAATPAAVEHGKEFLNSSEATSMRQQAAAAGEKAKGWAAKKLSGGGQ